MPTTALQPGMTGAQVRQLQDYLVSIGYMTQEQVNTGYGTYGPQTTAAVAKYQTDHGVDTSGGGVGYWGPKTIAAAQAGTKSTSTTPIAVDVNGTTQYYNSSGQQTNASGTPITTTPSSNATPTTTSSATGAFASLSAQDQAALLAYGISANQYNSDSGQVRSQWLANAQRAYAANSSTPTPTSTTASTGIQPPTVNLQPGDTGAQVKQLQDYLVSQGLMTQAQVDTGYGTYGPQTTAAVKALQEKLGVDNSTGVGYFGPRTIAAVTATPATTIQTTDGTSNVDTTDPGLTKILQNPNLTPDQKAVIQSIFGAVQNNDADMAARIQAAMKAASEFSDPYFKAQIRLAIDALDRGLSSKEGDLAFAEKQKQAALDELRASTAASKDQLSFQHQQELQNLAIKYETDLNTTRDNMAAAGLTSSSKRARAEDILNTQNQGLVESSNKTYGYQTGNLDRTLAANTADTAATLENLRRLNEAGKLDLYRTAENAVGSVNLPSVSGMTSLGDVGGTIPRDQVKDALSFANNFVL